MVTPKARREVVAHVCEAYDVSQRRACRLLQADRSSVRYQRRRSDDSKLGSAVKRIALERRRFGYRRIHALLQREGFRVNIKKVYRLYREAGLQVRKRSGRKRAIGTRRPMLVPISRTSAGLWTLCRML